MTTVLDTTVLLNFGRCEALWVLERSLPSECIVVPDVVAEIVYPLEAVNQRSAIDAGWLRVHGTPSETEAARIGELQQRSPRLGLGELSSLAACLPNGWAVASDGREAREVSVESRITLTGSIGILLGAIEDGILELAQAEQLFGRMLASGYRAPMRRLAHLLDD